MSNVLSLKLSAHHHCHMVVQLQNIISYTEYRYDGPLPLVTDYILYSNNGGYITTTKTYYYNTVTNSKKRNKKKIKLQTSNIINKPYCTLFIF